MSRSSSSMRYMRVVLELQDLDLLVSSSSRLSMSSFLWGRKLNNYQFNKQHISLSWIFIHIFNHFPLNFPVFCCLSLSRVIGNMDFSRCPGSVQYHVCSAGSEVLCLMRSVCTLLPNKVCRRQLRASLSQATDKQTDKPLLLLLLLFLLQLLPWWLFDLSLAPDWSTGVSDVTRVQVTDGWMPVGHSPSEFLTSCSCSCYSWSSTLCWPSGRLVLGFFCVD